MIRRLGPFCLIAAALALPFSPLWWQGSIPWLGDGELHLMRLGALKLAVQDGFWLGRWVPSLAYGYGFPLFHFYAPLAYYAVLPIYALGLSLSKSIVLSYLIAYALLVSALYLAGKQISGPLGGTAAALFGGLSPYFLINLWHRAALAELWGLGWFALALWAITAGRNRWLYVAVTGLMLSHNISALIGVPLLFGWMITGWWGRTEDSPIDPATQLVACLGALGSTLFFWLPALLETDWVQIDRLTDASNFGYFNQFLNLDTLFRYPAASAAHPALINPPLPYSLGWVSVGLAVAGGIIGVRTTQTRLTAGMISLATLLCVVMTLPASDFLWRVLPLISFVQFPWRFLGPAAIGIALLIGIGFGHAERYDRRAVWLLIPLWLLMGIFAVRYLAPAPSPIQPGRVTEADLARFERETGWLGTTAAADYLPRPVAELPDTDAVRPRFEGRTLSIPVTAEPTILPIFDYPNWTVETDRGETLAHRSSDPTGQIEIDVPSGVETVHVGWTISPLWGSTGIVSTLFATLSILLLWFSIPPWRDPAPESARTTPPEWIGVALLIAGPLLLFTLGRAPLEASRPMMLNFDNRLQLTGADLPDRPIPADQVIDLTLYWQGLRFDEELSVGIHLIDPESGLVIAQSDHLHPADYPLPRWSPEQIGLDRHRLTLPAGAAPGRYPVRLFIYDASGTRQEILNSDRLPIGVEADLGTIEITRPERYPRPEELQLSNRNRYDVSTDFALVGSDLSITQASDGESILVRTGWLALRGPSDTPSLQIALGDEALIDIPNGPTVDWEANEVRIHSHLIRVPLGTRSGLYPLRLISPNGEHRLGDIEVTQTDRQFTPPPLNLRLETGTDFATLLGLSELNCSREPGSDCTLALVWRPTAEVTDDYQLFVQLLSRDSVLIAQLDRPPVRRTSSWLPDEIIVDPVSLPIPADVETDGSRLIIGLYSQETGQRATFHPSGLDFATIPAVLSEP